MEMTTGQNAEIGDLPLVVEVQSAPGVEQDVVVLGVGDDDRVTRPQWRLGLGKTTAPGAALTASTGPGVRTVRISVALLGVPAAVQRLLVVASSPGGESVSCTLRSEASRQILASYASGAVGRGTSVVTVELYRRGDGWKVRALGEMYRGTLESMAQSRGFSSGTPAPEPAPAPGGSSPTHAAHPAPTSARPVAPAAASFNWLSPPPPPGYEERA